MEYQSVNQLNLPYDSAFLLEPEANDLFAELEKLKGWYSPAQGRKRITFYDGADMVSNYRGTKETVRPWTQAPTPLMKCREKITVKYGAPFPNICRIQHYEEGGSIAPHRDQKAEGSWDFPIATISLGAERWFRIHECTCEQEGPCGCCIIQNIVFDEELAAGSLLEMPSGFQANHKHSIVPTKNECGVRISLTFRYLPLEATPTHHSRFILHKDAFKPPYATIGGYSGYQVVSAMQKSVRRGLEQDALFWASELWASCDATGREYIWHRLRVIASEDVGLADNAACVQVSALYGNFLRRPNEKLFLWHAVLLLCRAPKSRIVGHAGVAITKGPRDGKQIPSFAVDNHAGGKMNWTESFKLENCTLRDEYEKDARAIWEKEKEGNCDEQQNQG
jgi:alkylated DNA repair dioxygenase AlkB